MSHQPLTSALRRCRQPVPARVAVADGRPVRVTTDRRGFAGGAVTHCAGPWRTSGEWWVEPGAGGAGPWDRDEWDVSLNDGAVYRVFRDRGDRWFIALSWIERATR
jgi:protein ImuB